MVERPETDGAVYAMLDDQRISRARCHCCGLDSWDLSPRGPRERGHHLAGTSRERRALFDRVCIANFRSRRGDGDRFDDWVVGHQFVPDCLHHAVVRLKLWSAFLRLLRQNAGFRTP
jgi:hypothetical protein